MLLPRSPKKEPRITNTILSDKGSGIIPGKI